MASTTRNGATSHVTARLATVIASGRSTLLTGSVGDLVLHRGEALSLPALVERLGTAIYQVVVRLNAADPPTIVHGQEAYARARRAAGLPDVATDEGGEAATDGASRRERIDALQSAPQATTDPVDVVRALLEQDEVSVLVMIDQADIMLQDPAVHDLLDRHRVAALQLALRHASSPGPYRNCAVLLAADIRSIPSVLLGSNEDLVIVEAARPSWAERRALLTDRLDLAHDAADLDHDDRQQIADQLAALTDGDRLRTLVDLLEFSARARVPVTDARALVDRFRSGPRQDHWGHLAGRLPEVAKRLGARVFGQDEAVDMVVRSLAAATLGLSLAGPRRGREGQPRGVMLFLGPTGVGKTELAKAVAREIFGDEEAYFRLDMSTIKEAHDAGRLLGAPPGYVGFEQGGELTNAVLRRPALVILLDEIDKAHEAALDRLLSILDDGRVTDAQGRVAYFSEAIIIATSNAGATELMAAVRVKQDRMTYEEVRQICDAALRKTFDDIRRPEIYGRLAPGVVVFDYLREEVVDQITDKVIDDIRFENGPAPVFDPPSTRAYVRRRMADPAAAALGGRQVRNELRTIISRVAAWIVVEGHLGADVVKISFSDDDLQVSVDGGPTALVP